jgi:hypothetical protein
MMHRQRLGGDNSRANAQLGGFVQAANARKSASRAGNAVLAVIPPAVAYSRVAHSRRANSSIKVSSSMNAARVLATLNCNVPPENRLASDSSSSSSSSKGAPGQKRRLESAKSGSKGSSSSSSKGAPGQKKQTLCRKESNDRVEKRMVTEIAGRAFNAMDQLASPGAVTCRYGFEFFSTAVLEGESRPIVLATTRADEKWCKLYHSSPTRVMASMMGQ